MKAKKPLLLSVFILALLAVALIVPAVAFGANPNQPVASASAGANGNNTYLPDGQAGYSVAVQQLGELGVGPLRGHVAIKSIKYVDNPLGPQGKYLWFGTDFLTASSAPVFDPSYVPVFDSDNGNAMFYALLDVKVLDGELFPPEWQYEETGLYLYQFFLVDSGEPGIGTDYMVVLMWLQLAPDVYIPVPAMDQYVPVGNVQIH